MIKKFDPEKVFSNNDPRLKVFQEVSQIVKNRRGGTGYAIMTKEGTICGRFKNKDGQDFRISEMVVQNEKNIADTVLTAIQPKVYGDNTNYRIRKLTERECFRLMDVDDNDIDKILAEVSRTQALKMAGNSIVVSCLYHIFRKMFVETEKEEKGELDLF